MYNSQGIIVVEDDASMSQALERLLKAAGWQPRMFDSAEALLDSNSAKEADCFIFDIELPGLSGLELRSRLHALEIKRPTFFITAYDQAAVREKAENGSAGYFTKPFDGRSLIAAIARTLAIVLFLALVLVPLSAMAQRENVKRVLIVHSFGNAAPPFTVHAMAFETELTAKLGEKVDLDEVSLDMARYADPDMQEAIVEYLEKRKLKWQPDIVVPIGAPAGMFVATYRERLFPRTPILYCSMDQRLLLSGALDNNAAYIGQIFDIPGWIEDMLKVAPSTRNIAVVVGATPLEKYWKEAFEKAAAPFSDRIHFIYFNDLSFDQMLEKSKTLPPDSFIFILLLLRDAAGVSHNADEALQRLHAVANAPINGIFDHQMGLGILGGRLFQSERVGTEAADIAIRILNGEPASSFEPKLIEPTQPRYDWRELHRWKIDEARLPSGSTVLYRAPNAWQQYRGWIIFGLSVFVAEALLIFALLANLIWRHRVERSLVESEARFRNMADTAPVHIWVTGPDSLCTFVNKVWLAFTGRSLEQELGDGWTENVHPEDRMSCLNTYLKAFGERKPCVMQYRLRRHDGIYRTVTDEGIPRYDAAGKFLGYIGACIDITDQLEQQKAFHESEERVALATEAAQLGAWELDCRTGELWLSEKVRALFELPFAKPISYADFEERVHPEDRERRHGATERAIETKGSYELEYRLLLPDGAIRWIAGRGHCIPNEDGKSCRLLGVSMDVTSRKLAEEAAKHSRQQIDLLSRVSLLGEMTASLAHELNQPLSAIVNNASAGMRFIEKGNLDPETLHEIMVDVVADGRRAHEIIHAVRQTIKKGSAIRQRIDLNDTIGKVVHMVQSDAQVQSCEMETALEDDLPEIEGDPVQIQQVFVNLLSNAFDAMHDTARTNRKVKITTERNGKETVCVSVRDRGPGIAGEARDHLFEQFFTTKDDGLGMGLSIVRTIIEAHGGKIGADNAEGGGARFFFTLPTTKENLS
ncbi:MAG TPA: PAS domain-containing protein [Chthoniobacterales bacterium]|nr:PAS domain-containing protein [Chthoniobacterales bacterium]